MKVSCLCFIEIRPKTLRYTKKNLSITANDERNIRSMRRVIEACIQHNIISDIPTYAQKHTLLHSTQCNETNFQIFVFLFYVKDLFSASSGNWVVCMLLNKVDFNLRSRGDSTQRKKNAQSPSCPCVFFISISTIFTLKFELSTIQ